MKVLVAAQSSVSAAPLYVGERLLQHPPSNKHDSLDERIHGVRIRIKELKAWLRLNSKAGIPEAKVLLKRLKQAADSLALWRERSTLRRQLQNLHEKYSGLDINFEVLRDNTGTHDPALQALEKAERIVLEVTTESESWTQKHQLDSSRLVLALESSLRRCRKAYKRCHRDPQAAKPCHKLRKRTKDFMYQLELLKPFLDREPGKLVKVLHRISQKLGQGHDWQLLDGFAQKHRQLFASDERPRTHRKLRRLARKSNKEGLKAAKRFMSQKNTIKIKISTRASTMSQHS
jgi:CHAD domain-containing protein